MKTKLFIASVAIAFSSTSYSSEAQLQELAEHASQLSSELCVALGELSATSLDAMSVNPQNVYEILIDVKDEGLDWYDSVFRRMMQDLNKTTMQPADFGLHWQNECMKGAQTWVYEMVNP